MTGIPETGTDATKTAHKRTAGSASKSKSEGAGA